MKHLLSSVAVAAVLAIAAPVWAQGGGNPIGTPGPNPGGPGLTPYSTGAPPPAAAPSSMSDTTSAMPPKHRHARAHHAMHGKMAGHRAPQLTGSTANQLNQEELARLQAGNYLNPAAPPGPGVPPPPPSSRVPGPKTSGSGYIPPQPGAGTVPPAPSPGMVGTTPGGAR
jgi:hypothetical protein